MTGTGSARSRRPRSRATVTSVIGELLLTAGVLVVLYLGWQFWFNDLLARSSQEQTASGLSEQWQSDPVMPDAVPDAPADAVPVVAKPAEGEGFAVLHIPRFGKDWERPVIGGTTVDVLDRGVGHYDETQLPGQPGNFALAGHRTTYGSPFNGIANLRLGDAIVVETKQGWYTYRFRNLEYVLPTGTDVLYPVPQYRAVSAKDSVLTMTSCNPMFSAAERIVAYSVFDSFTPRSDGPPATLQGGA